MWPDKKTKTGFVLEMQHYMQVFVLPPWRLNSEEGASSSLETPAIELPHVLDKGREETRYEAAISARSCISCRLRRNQHLSAPVQRVCFSFSSFSVTAALGHNFLVARHCTDNVSKGLQLALGQAGESKSEAPRYEAQQKKRKDTKFSGRQEPARLAVEHDRLQTAAEVFN